MRERTIIAGSKLVGGSMTIVRVLAAAVTVFGLAACEVGPMKPAASDIPAYTFTTKLDVANVAPVQGFDSATLTPAERSFADRLVSAVGAWANSRLKPVGKAGTAKVVVRNASIAEQVQGQQGRLYESVLDVRVEAVDPRSNQPVAAEARVTSRRSAPGTVTPEQREQLWAEMARDMVNDLDAKLPPQVRSKLGNLVVP